jgi:pimeloyl-ACP methyl ester carboxylesterase
VHFTGRHEHRVVADAGHNLPQEAPRAFAQAVLGLQSTRQTLR